MKKRWFLRNSRSISGFHDGNFRADFLKLFNARFLILKKYTFSFVYVFKIQEMFLNFLNKSQKVPLFCSEKFQILWEPIFGKNHKLFNTESRNFQAKFAFFFSRKREISVSNNECKISDRSQLMNEVGIYKIHRMIIEKPQLSQR